MTLALCRRGSLLGSGIALVSASLCLACTTDHSNLKKRGKDDPSDQPAFNFGDDGGAAGAGAGPATPPPEVDPRAGLPPEPPGNPALTLLHAVVDAKTIYFCVAASAEDGQELRLFASPLPDGGLAYGESMVLTPSDELDFKQAALSVYLIAAEPEFVQDKDCGELLQAGGLEPPVMADVALEPFASERRLLLAQTASAAADASADPGDAGLADAGRLRDGGAFGVFDASTLADAAAGHDASTPKGADASADAPRDAAPSGDAGSERPVVIPELRVQPLAALPAGSLASFSHLLSPSGCLGAPTFEDEIEELLCGPGYSSRRTTLTPIFVRLSRRSSFDSVGFQVVNANPAFPLLTLRSAPGESEFPTLTLASDVSFGQIAPRQTRTGVAAARLGDPLGRVPLQIVAGTGNPVFTIPWSVPLESSGISGLEDGHAYTVILMGPVPGLTAESWWNGTLLSLVRNDPVRQ